MPTSFMACNQCLIIGYSSVMLNNNTQCISLPTLTDKLLIPMQSAMTVISGQQMKVNTQDFSFH